MKIQAEEWQSASGSYVEDDNRQLWQLVGFIDQPAMILAPVKIQGSPMSKADNRTQQVIIMGSKLSEQFHLLKRA